MDIVMLVHDQAAWASMAVRAVEAFTLNPYRLIIVDSASKEKETHDWLGEMENRGHTIVRLGENRSFSSGVNAGIDRGDSKFVCVLNDDAIVTEGWDGAMLQDASAKHVGLVGARSNFASGAQMDPAFVGDPPYLVFVCVALRREVWKAVGPLDEETFDGFSSEDIDYSWRVRKAGYKLAVSKGAFVLHAGSRTLGKVIGVHLNGVAQTEARARNDAKYNARLIEKWGKEWVERNSRTVQKVLVASYHPDNHTSVDFMDDFVNLKAHGGYAFNFLRVKRCPIQVARNQVYDLAFDQGYDYLVQLDDDARFPPDTIRRLLSHQKDVVCALAYQRKPPHLTCAFELGEDGLLGASMEGIERTGLRKVDVSGFHVSAIRISTVVKKLREGVKDGDGKILVPGTRHYHGGFDNRVGEDFAACINMKKLGIQVYVDTDFIAGHIGDSILVDEGYRLAFRSSK
jgi:GT2 family glycosyltransferase